MARVQTCSLVTQLLRRFVRRGAFSRCKAVHSAAADARVNGPGGPWALHPGRKRPGFTAQLIKSREGGRTVGVAVLVATAVNDAGQREIIGLDTATTETGAAWTAFLR
ncbi:MAG: hypothetical protein EOP64_08240, partial [Sphingomonas sp.]